MANNQSVPLRRSARIAERDINEQREIYRGMNKMQVINNAILIFRGNTLSEVDEEDRFGAALILAIFDYGFTRVRDGKVYATVAKAAFTETWGFFQRMMGALDGASEPVPADAMDSDDHPPAAGQA
jgi:hypothetical protein